MVAAAVMLGLPRPRQFGFTTYQCHVLCGHLNVTRNETQVVLLRDLNRVTSWMHTLEPILLEHDIILKHFDRRCWRLLFENNTNMVKFMSLDTIKRMHPCEAGADPWGYRIEDLD